jgi:hypothetical protein
MVVWPRESNKEVEEERGAPQRSWMLRGRGMSFMATVVFSSFIRHLYTDPNAPEAICSRNEKKKKR